ncbi:hypothetical protein LZ554_003218 [Drepanopeziza brunnea f. sp. 'monogermtubi']|nr:hypothetical protein LZ554_003218 [Drepanopeziza brunnea f. sp. 'monogermtubi']
MAAFSTLVKVLALAFAVVASPIAELNKRSVLAHDAVVSLPETVPIGPLGDLYRRYQPILMVAGGCVPFPAVDADGNVGGGLGTTGSANGGCSQSTGQIYVRSADYGGNIVLIYAWYFPKDEPSPWFGHRNDWESVVIYVASENSTTAADVRAVCPSAHGRYDCVTSGIPFSGTSVRVEYTSEFWPLNHALKLTPLSLDGGQQPLVAWESMPAAARDSLATFDFGNARVPIRDPMFWTNVHLATWV